MSLITDKVPQNGSQLEELVTAILNECKMKAQRHVSLRLPRGSVVVDVLAEEAVDGIAHRTIVECKNWSTNVSKDIVHAFRTVMHEAGANRGYIVSRVGFQKGAKEAAEATNIELVTFMEFQNIYFDKWFKNRIWALENKIGDFNTYYEPLGPPGYSQLGNDDERAAYDVVWEKYRFAGAMLQPFSPYLRILGPFPIPSLPFDVSDLEKNGVKVPNNIKAATAYREFFEILERYAKIGLEELRVVNPVTRGQPRGAIERDD